MRIFVRLMLVLVLTAQSTVAWRARRELRVGDIDGPASIPDVAAAALAPSGEVYVASRQDGAVFAFSHSGQLLRKTGRKGSGPGEFLGPSAIAVNDSGIWVFDAAAQRATLFDSGSGTFKRTARLPSASESNQGTFTTLGIARSGFVGTFALTSQSETPMPQPVLYVKEDGNRDTVTVLSTNNVRVAIRDPQRPWAGLFGVQPFNDSPVALFSPRAGELVVIERSAGTGRGGLGIVVHRINVENKRSSTRRYATAPVPVPEAVRDSIIARWADAVLRARGPNIRSLPEATKRVKEALFLPRHYPPVSGAFIDSDGRIWLRRESTPTRLIKWSIIGANGDLLGDALLPAETTLFGAVGATAWGWTKAELDVPVLDRFSLQR